MSRWLGGGAVFVSMMPSVPDAGVEKVSLVCLEVHLVRANSTPLRKKESSSGFVPLVPGLPWLPPTERTSGRPTLSCPLSPSDISGPRDPKSRHHSGFALFCFVLSPSWRCKLSPHLQRQMRTEPEQNQLPASSNEEQLKLTERLRSSSWLVRSQIF